MSDLVAQLTALLEVEQLEPDLYRGPRQPGGVGRVFGGQVVAQALQAAQRTVEPEKPAHSLHCYFMRPGSEDHSILYRVHRDFDGRSFATRRVIALQNDTPILTLTASFQREARGFHHQAPMPDVPGPQDLRSEAELRESLRDQVPDKLRRFFLRARPIEIRPVAPRNWFAPTPAEPVQHSWLRTMAPLPDDPALHRAVLAYASDMTLLGTSLLPHGASWLTGEVQTASLDHTVWLHAPFRADEWLLYTTDSPWAGHARGFNRGRFYTQDGRLIASVAQEGLIRVNNLR